MSLLREILKKLAPWFWLIAVGLVIVALVIYRDRWLPSQGESAEAESDHAAHDSGPAAADNTIEVSPQAQLSMGLKPLTVAVKEDDQAKITIPGVIVERGPRTTIEVSAPLTGVIEHIYPTQSEGVAAGAPLFTMRMTHEDLVQAQVEYLRAAEELKAVNFEVERLQKAGSAVAGKTLNERQYEQRKQQAVYNAQRQALLLHGLSGDQVDEILVTGTLLRELIVVVPKPKDASQPAAAIYQVQELFVQPGKRVEAGAPLCKLADHSQLFIEGEAFEQDIPLISQLVDNQWPVTAILESSGQELKGPLHIHDQANRMDAETRTFHFYIKIANPRMKDRVVEEERTLVSWQYKPGQRMRIKAPIEPPQPRIVLPAGAVARDGLENYVFQINGTKFERVPVQVLRRDEDEVVIANDGSIYPGAEIADSGAHQLLLAMKNKTAGPVDPHAGHAH